MTVESRTTPQRHFSWKQSRDPEHLPPLSRTAKRWLTTLGVGLFAVMFILALLFWLLNPHRYTYFVVAHLLNYHPPEIPPNSGADGDAAAYAALVSSKYFKDPKLETMSDLAALGPFFKNLPAKKNDVLLVFMSGHGVSRDGVAYLLPSDAWAQQERLDGKCDAPTLLSAVSSSAAGHELLILDTGRLDADPRLGMVVNEFPRLVEQHVRETPDAPWVLLPADMFQTNLVDYVKNRSHFGRLVEKALAGDADTNKDYSISLKELYVYVAAGLAPYSQTPLLLQGGVGKVPTADSIPRLELLRYTKKKLVAENDKAGDKGKFDAQKELQKAQKLESDVKSTESSIRNLPSSTLRGNPSLPPVLTPSTGPSAAPASSPAANGAPPATASPGTAPAKGSTPEGVPPATVTPGSGTAPAAVKPTMPTDPKPASPATPIAPVAEPPPNPATLTKRDRLSLGLADCWKLRDRLRRNSDSQIWLPCDYAPHRWRELDAVLLDLERRSRGGDFYETRTVLDHLSGLAKELESLVRAHEPGAPAELDLSPRAADDTLDVVRNIDVARREFRAAMAARVPRAAIPADAAAVMRARQIFDSAVYEASDFLRWQLAEVLVTGKSHDAGMVDLASLLGQLATLQAQLDDLALATFDNEKRDKLVASASAVDKTHKDLRRQFAEHAERLLAPPAPSAANHAFRQRQLEAALQTPLADADLRHKLIASLFTASSAHSDDPVDVKRGPAVTGTPPWNELRAVLDLESKLVVLAEPVLSDAKLAETLDKCLRKLEGAHEEESYVEYRKIGLLLRESQAGLLEKMRKAFIDSRHESIARSLWLIDPRDSRPLAPEVHALNTLSVKRRPALEFGLAPPDFELLDTWQWFAVPVAAIALNEKDHKVELRLSFDESRMLLRRGEGMPELRSGTALNIPIDELTAGAIRIQARARQAESAGGPVPLDLNLELTLQGVSQNAPAPLLQKIACRLPSPERIALRVQRIDSSRQRTGAGSGLRLEPFPNRDTAFQFWLVNESGRDRNVSVELWSVPPIPSATWAPGRLVVAQNQVPNVIRQELFKDLTARVMKLRSDLDAARLLFQAESVVLKADANNPVEVPFKPWPPKAEAVADPAASPGAAPGATATPSAALPAPDISQGLLCVITDKTTERQWLEWIEIVPLRPERYLQSKLKYNVGMQRIEAEVSLRKDIDDDGQDDKIPGLVKMPVGVHLQFDESQFSAEGLHRSTDLVRPGETRTLYVGARADGQERRLALTVDSFPRAYRYNVKCDEVVKEAVAVTNRAELRITRLSASYIGTDLPGSPVARDEVFDFTAPGAIRRAMFPAPARELLVGLEVDAPENAFEDTAGRDVIELRLRGQDKRIESFYSDRQVRTNLVKLSADGVLTLHSKVTDYSIPLATAGLENLLVDLDAGMYLEGASRADARPVEVQLDGRRPRIDPPINVRVAPSGKAILLHADVLAEDGSLGTGVQYVEFHIDKNQNKELDEKEDPFLRAVASKGSGHWSIAWDLSKLELTPDQPYLIFVRAIDRVGWVGKPDETNKVAGFKFPALADVAPKVFGSVKGSVKLREVPVTKGRATLEIRDATGKVYIGVPDDKGQYVIRNVPAGRHKLLVKGEFLNTPISEMYDIEIPATPPAELTLDIKLK